MLPNSTYTLQCVQNTNYIIMQAPSYHFTSFYKEGCYFMLILKIYFSQNSNQILHIYFCSVWCIFDQCNISVINFNLKLFLDMQPSFFFLKKDLTFQLPSEGYMQVNKSTIRGNCFVCFRNNCQLRCVRLTMYISIRTPNILVTMLF